MKSSSKRILFLILPVLAAVWGCKNQVPTSTSYATGGVTDTSMLRVDDFDAGTTIVNPNLYTPFGAGPVSGGGWSVTILNASAASAVTYQWGSAAPGASGTPGAVRIFGSLFDPASSVNAPTVTFAFSLNPAGTGKYDARLFRGIRFYYKTGNDDDAPSRFFSVSLTNTSTNGTDFTNPLTPTGGVWRQVHNEFNQMKRPFWAIPLDPPNLSGANLALMSGFSWSESRSQNYGVSTVDFWVDEIFFY